MTPARGPRILFDGQSLNFAPFPGPVEGTYPGLTMTSLPYMWWNVGWSGRSWTVLLNGDPSVGLLPAVDRYHEHGVSGQPVIAVLNGGQSDILAPESQTAAAAYADLITYCNAIRPACDQIIVTTMGPMTAGFAGFDPTTAINAYNTLVRAGNPAYDAYVDLAVVPGLMNASDLSAYTDGAHYTSASATLAAGAVRPQIVSAAAALAA